MREQWIKLHLEKKIPITEIAELSGYHQDTLYIWKAKYLKHGREGLIPQSRAPHSHPNEYTNGVKSKIKLLRKQGRGICADIIKIRLKKRYDVKASRSGVAGFLKKEGLVNPKLSRRIKNKKKRVKKCKIHEPGQLIQFDVKYAFKSFADAWFYQYSSIDYLTGIAYGAIYEIQSNLEGILFIDYLSKLKKSMIIKKLSKQKNKVDRIVV